MTIRELRRASATISRTSPGRTGLNKTGTSTPGVGLNQGFVFIHINKTAGVSIGKALGLEKQHLTAREYKNSLGNRRWDKMFKFTIVRNPWDKVVSHYFHRVKTNQTGLGNNPIGFKEWVKLTYSEQNP